MIFFGILSDTFNIIDIEAGFGLRIYSCVFLSNKIKKKISWHKLDQND